MSLAEVDTVPVPGGAGRRRPTWATVVVLLAAVAAWWGLFFAQAAAVADDVALHGGAAGWDDFWPRLWAALFASWPGELLHLAILLAVFRAWARRERAARTRLEYKIDLLVAARHDRP